MAVAQDDPDCDVSDVAKLTLAMNEDKLSEECLKYTRPYHMKVHGKNDHLEAYVRLQRRGGCIRVVVPFPVGPSVKREKTFRISDHMTAEDLLKHAQYTNKMMSQKSLALRHQFINPKKARRMAKPDENGCIGSLRYRRAINQFAVPYIDERGFMCHKIFYIPPEDINDIVAVYAIRDQAVAFAKNLLDTGAGTPIRRRFRRPFRARECNPITRYFSTIESTHANSTVSQRGDCIES